MQDIIGQDRLRARIGSYTAETLPKTLLFIGPAGCGKKLFSLELANQVKLPLVDIDDKVTADQLIEYSQKPYKTIYRINLNNFNEKMQNQFLKFIEEPADSVYVMLLADSEIGILPTILNRCIKLPFAEYTKEELKKCAWMLGDADDQLIFEVCKTPGQFYSISPSMFVSLHKDAENFIRSSAKMSYAQIMAFYQKINLKENYDKYDLDITLNTLEYLSFKLYKDEKVSKAYEIYKAVNNTKQLLRFRSLAKEPLVFSMLNDIYKETR